MAEAPVGMKRFYALLAGIAVLGVGVLGYLLGRPGTVSIPANVTVQSSDTAGFHGYVLGSPSAPVEITEYADYQCPFCQTFATLQMPTIEERLIKTGRLRWRYRDFPLQQHPFARLAAHSAACADEQGKFWQQHERIYEGQADWAASRNAAPLFRRYAQEIGLDLGRYDAC
ncbi:MAG TPA: thioredoxin domain-containing protein, partial [Gemmatimonadales bacterium]|nr:thioredoxin domain-containing protein [Gemmatimonadales bacterium]